MTNPEQTTVISSTTVVDSNITDYSIYGNPTLKIRIANRTQTMDGQTFTYSFVDATSNTFIHTNVLETKEGEFL